MNVVTNKRSRQIKETPEYISLMSKYRAIAPTYDANLYPTYGQFRLSYKETPPEGTLQNFDKEVQQLCTHLGLAYLETFISNPTNIFISILDPDSPYFEFSLSRDDNRAQLYKARYGMT